MHHGVGYAMGHVSTLGSGHQIDQSQIRMYKVVTREKRNTQHRQRAIYIKSKDIAKPNCKKGRVQPTTTISDHTQVYLIKLKNNLSSETLVNHFERLLDIEFSQ